jgi:hypothetical protein
MVQFIQRVVFKGDVQFEQSVVFNSDTAGYAVIKKGSRSVDVAFGKELPNKPILTASISFDQLNNEDFMSLVSQGDCSLTMTQDECLSYVTQTILNSRVSYLITHSTSKGFMLVLNENAPIDIRFAWNAVQVRDPKSSLSGSTSLNISPSPVPSVTAVPHQDISVTPTSMPIVTPSITPTSTVVTPSPVVTLPDVENITPSPTILTPTP